MNRRLGLALGIGLLVLATPAYFGIRSLFRAKPMTERSEIVQRGEVAIRVVETGLVEPRRRVEVKSQVGGRLRKFFAEEGDKVQQGQLLAIVDPQENNGQTAALQTQLNTLEARIALVRNGRNAQAATPLQQEAIRLARANRDAAKAELTVQQSALSLLEKSTLPKRIQEAERAVAAASPTERPRAERSLKEQQLSNTLERAQAKSRVAQAQSKVQERELAIAEVQAGETSHPQASGMDFSALLASRNPESLASALANRNAPAPQNDLASLETQARELRLLLRQTQGRQEETRLVAPLSGTVIRRYLEPGELINSAFSSTFGQTNTLFQIADLRTMLVRISVNEVDVAQLKAGLPTDVTLDTAKGTTFQGQVRRVAQSALSDLPARFRDTSQAMGQTVVRFPVEIEIRNPDARIKPGMNARCAVIVARRPNVLRLPTGFIEGSGDKGTAQVVRKSKDGTETVESRAVTIGLRGEGFIEILSGLAEGERVRPAPYYGPPRKKIAFDPLTGSVQN